MTPVVLVSLVCVFLLSKPISAYQLERVCPQYGASISPRSAVVLILLSSVLSACVAAFCRTDLVRRHRGSASCEKPVRHGTKPILMIPACFLGGAGFCLLCDLIARWTVFCTDGAEYQHRDSFVWRTGRYLYYGASEVPPEGESASSRRGIGANPWQGPKRMNTKVSILLELSFYC